MLGCAWPGAEQFPDSTRNPDAAAVGRAYKEFVENGVSGIFCNEDERLAVFDGPGLTMLLDNIHRIEDWQLLTLFSH